MELLVKGEEEEDESRSCATSVRGLKAVCQGQPPPGARRRWLEGKQEDQEYLRAAEDQWWRFGRVRGSGYAGHVPGQHQQSRPAGRQLQRPFQNMIKENGAVGIFTQASDLYTEY